MTDQARAIDHLSVWAVRYALGRATYAPHDVVDTLIAHRDVLSAQSHLVIVRDITEAEQRQNLGWPVDARAWIRLRDALEEPAR